MKKKLIVLLLCALSFVAGIGFSNIIPSSSAANDGINRSPDVIYSEDDYEWERDTIIYVQTNDKYYHDWSMDCCFTNKELEPLDVSLYEAVERGYSPCPNCYRPQMEISPYQWNKMIKKD